MDMNSGYGGFAANLVSEPVWVMNVVPAFGVPNTLHAIFDRGLIGVLHDWQVSLTDKFSIHLLSVHRLKHKSMSEDDLKFAIFLFICRCEPFSTYPRTYDLIHVSNLMQSTAQRFCYFYPLRVIHISRLQTCISEHSNLSKTGECRCAKVNPL